MIVVFIFLVFICFPFICIAFVRRLKSWLDSIVYAALVTCLIYVLIMYVNSISGYPLMKPKIHFPKIELLESEVSMPINPSK
jgi:hypothetical protein